MLVIVSFLSSFSQSPLELSLGFHFQRTRACMVLVVGSSSSSRRGGSMRTASAGKAALVWSAQPRHHSPFHRVGYSTPAILAPSANWSASPPPGGCLSTARVRFTVSMAVAVGSSCSSRWLASMTLGRGASGKCRSKSLRKAGGISGASTTVRPLTTGSGRGCRARCANSAPWLKKTVASVSSVVLPSWRQNRHA